MKGPCKTASNKSPRNTTTQKNKETANNARKQQNNMHSTSISNIDQHPTHYLPFFQANELSAVRSKKPIKLVMPCVLGSKRRRCKRRERVPTKTQFRGDVKDWWSVSWVCPSKRFFFFFWGLCSWGPLWCWLWVLLSEGFFLGKEVIVDWLLQGGGWKASSWKNQLWSWHQ